MSLLANMQTMRQSWGSSNSSARTAGFALRPAATRHMPVNNRPVVVTMPNGAQVAKGSLTHALMCQEQQAWDENSCA